MDRAKLDLLIRKTITPRSSLSSLLICISRIGKTDADAACAFTKALCEHDISKAALVSQRLSGPLAENCLAVIRTELRRRCAEPDSFSSADLLAICEFDDSELFRLVIPSLTPPVISQAFLACSSQSACRLMTMCSRYTEGDVLELCRQEFCTFLNHYDSSGEDALKELLPVLLEHNEVAPLSKLIDTVGVDKLESLCGDAWSSEVDRLIVSGFDSPALWDAYFSVFFREPHTTEELLLRGLWHLQFYAGEETEPEAAASFYLNAAQKLGLDHEIFAYTDCFEAPQSFSRKQSLRYHEALNALWEQPEELVRFIDQTALCNPFSTQVLQEERFTLIRDSQDFQDYNRLSMLFERKMDCAAIVKLFFYTNLKNTLPLEDLLYLSQRHDMLEEMLAELKKLQFSGKVIKYKMGLIVLSPISYHVMALHTLRVPYFVLEHTKGNKQDLKGNNLIYVITGYNKGQIQVEAFLQEQEASEVPRPSKTWESAVNHLTYCLEGPRPHFPAVGGGTKTLLGVSVDTFATQYDFGLLIDLMLRHPSKLNGFAELFRQAKWNTTFMPRDLLLPVHFYSDLGKYQDQSILLFKAMFAAGVSYDEILNLYFTSIFKAIVPLDRLLELADREIMLKALLNQTIYLRLRTYDRTLCRPINVSCAPVCMVEDCTGLIPQRAFSAVVTDYTIVGGVVSRIMLKNQTVSTLSLKDRGALFGYLALNEPIGKRKRYIISQLPEVDSYDSREMVFNLQCMEEAILLRRADGDALSKLLCAMGRKNPFTFQINVRAEVSYLGRLRSDTRKKSVTNAMISMILNAASIQDIGNIYLNTSAKYYLLIPELISLIKGRRPELAPLISELFGGIQFQCTADSQGYLWSPLLGQSTVRVGQSYAGLLLTCEVQTEESGVTVQVMSAQESDDCLHPMALCLLTGYRVNDAITPYLIDALLKSGVAGDDEEMIRNTLQKEDSLRRLLVRTIGKQNLSLLHGSDQTEEMNAQMEQFRQMLTEEDFDMKFFKKQVAGMIRNCSGGVSMDAMENALADLSEELMQRFPDPEILFPYMREVFANYSYGYRDNGLAHIWIDQLGRYLGSNVASQYEAEIKANSRYKRNI